MEVRPIGLLEMLDQGVLDEKVLAVGKGILATRDVLELLRNLPAYASGDDPLLLDLQGPRRQAVEIKGWHDAAYARDKVLAAARQFEDAKKRQCEVCGINRSWRGAAKKK